MLDVFLLTLRFVEILHLIVPAVYSVTYLRCSSHRSVLPVGYLTESSLFPTPNTFPYHCLQSSKLSSFFLLLILYQQKKSLILPTRFDNRGFVFPYNF